MSKKKKTSAKQTKPNLQKPPAKPAKEAAVQKQSAPETSVELDVPLKSVQAQTQPAKGKKLDQSASRPSKAESSKAKAESSAKPEPSSSSRGQSSAKQTAPKSAQSQAKQQKKDSVQQPPEPKKKEEAKPAAKSQKGGKGAKKKDKAPRQSVETVLPPVEPSVSEATPIPESASASAPEAKRRVPKTLIDEETDFSPGRQGAEGDSTTAAQPASAASADAPAPTDAPRRVAKTILEVNIGGLKEAAAKATGIENKAQAPPPQQREVAKTLMDASTDGLRDTVEASSRAIEDEIAAAIRESDASAEGLADAVEALSRAKEDEIAAAIRESQAEAVAQIEPTASPSPASEPTDAEQMVANAAKHPEVKQADRKIAKTMLDFRADELFELANSDFDTLVEEAEPQNPSTPAAPPASPAPEPAAVQPRRVAKTMLELDVPDVNAIVEAAQSTAVESLAQEPVAQEPVAQERRSTYDEVSMDDLNEFAQALREDKPMSARAERLRKTMLGIRKHGLASSASLPGVKTTGETQQPQIAAQDTPVRVSRSLHPLDNFSFDNLCPADDETKAETQGDSQGDSFQDAPAESVWPGTVRRIGHDDPPSAPPEAPPEAPADAEFRGVTTVWPHDEEQKEQQQQQGQEVTARAVKPERFVAKTMLDMDFLKESLSASVIRAEEKLAESIALKAQEPPKQTLTSDDYKLASPNCPFVWTDGGVSKDRVRYCTHCSSQVYDFSGFDMAEAQSLIFKRENREGAHLYKREDGKFLTNDCPIAVKKKKDKAMLVGGGALALILLLIMVVISLITPQPQVATTRPVEAGTEKPAPAAGSSDLKPSSASTSATGAEPEGTFHYKRGKGITQSPAPAPTVVVPPEDTTVPGTNSGFDEGGRFWQYTDKGNN
ncbi:MAG: hypothetical protein IT342_26850 [Candidatus Melainabacteria bacterium]|nr:hypothetical protein [Candidatus Melainabacteria bacterium]